MMDLQLGVLPGLIIGLYVGMVLPGYVRRFAKWFWRLCEWADSLDKGR